MIRVDPSHWTADFRIARALAEAYSASGLSDVLFFCTGDPNDPVGFLGPMVADETRKYFPHVLGLSEAPITKENIGERVREARAAYPDAFVIAFEAGAGRALHLGSVEITDRPLSLFSAAGVAGELVFGDVTVSAVLRLLGGEDAPSGAPAPPAGGRGARAVAEAAREVGSDDDAPAGRKPFKPLRPDQINRYTVRKIADVIIDGNLRFLSKIGKQQL